MNPLILLKLSADIVKAADDMAAHILDSDDPQALILNVLDAANLKRAYIADHTRKQ